MPWVGLQCVIVFPDHSFQIIVTYFFIIIDKQCCTPQSSLIKKTSVWVLPHDAVGWSAVCGCIEDHSFQIIVTDFSFIIIDKESCAPPGSLMQPL